MKWEYLATWLGSDEDRDLHELGKREWELVSVVMDDSSKRAYFKRPLRTKSEDEIMKHFEGRQSLV
jgi:hypothetical protein